MSDTTFIDGTTVIPAAWAQDVNNTVYRALGSAGVAPTTPATVRTNLGVPADSAVVHNTGNETIAGNKTFSGTTVFSVQPTVPDASTAQQAAAFHQIADGVASATITSAGDPTFANSSSSPASTSWVKGYQQSRLYSTVPVNTTSGTSVDVVTVGTIPSWAQRITIMINGISTSGTSLPIIQVGSGSYSTSGYVSAASGGTNGASVTVSSGTTGLFLSNNNNASDLRIGHIILTKINGSNQWIESAFITLNGILSGGYSTGITPILGGALDRIKITTVGGTDTFDAGSISLLVEG